MVYVLFLHKLRSNTQSTNFLHNMYPKWIEKDSNEEGMQNRTSSGHGFNARRVVV